MKPSILNSLRMRLQELKEAGSELDNVNDPVAWLVKNAGFKPWQYEARILQDHALRLRVIRKSRQIGISTTIAYESLWKACTMPGRLILIVSPSDRQSRVVMDIVQKAVTGNAGLRGLVVRQNLSELVLSNGSQIISLPNNPDRIRGYAANDVILDEAAHFERAAGVMPVVSPMVAATGGTLTIISTPFTKRNLFWNWYKDALDSQGSDSTVKTYDLYPSTISPLISEEELERRKRGMLDLEFRQEFQGEFVEQLDSWLTMASLQACVDADLDVEEDFTYEPEYVYVLGVDFAKKRDQTVVVVIRVDVEKRKMRVVHVWAPAAGSLDYSSQIAYIKNIAGKFHVQYALGDQTGVGESVIEQLRGAVSGAEGLIFTVASKLDMAGGLKLLVESKRIELPDHRTMLMQLNSLSYEVRGNNLVFNTDEREHDDFCWGLMLAVKAGNRYIPVEGVNDPTNAVLFPGEQVRFDETAGGMSWL
jgi:phage FluMu gp28-like protein